MYITFRSRVCHEASEVVAEQGQRDDLALPVYGLRVRVALDQKVVYAFQDLQA